MKISQFSKGMIIMSFVKNVVILYQTHLLMLDTERTEGLCGKMEGYKLNEFEAGNSALSDENNHSEQQPARPKGKKPTKQDVRFFDSGISLGNEEHSESVIKNTNEANKEVGGNSALSDEDHHSEQQIAGPKGKKPTKENVGFSDSGISLGKEEHSAGVIKNSDEANKAVGGNSALSDENHHSEQQTNCR